MSAFDLSFDSSFDSLASDQVGIASAGISIQVARFYQPLSAKIEVSVVSPEVFQSSSGGLRWRARVIVGSVDVSARITGAINISAAEDSARVATLSVIPLSDVELNTFESQPVTIDVTLFRQDQMATYRRFTGVVETVEFMAGERVATLSCRDGYQERPKACTSADEVEALLGGMAVPNRKLVPWSDSEPDPSAYFDSLLQTAPGACFIDGDGIWRAIPWSIGAPSASFSGADIFENSLTVKRASRSSLPSAISARLNHRFYRLHAVEIDLTWEMFGLDQILIRGVTRPTVSLALEALNSLSGWYVKGTPSFVHPEPGATPVLVNGTMTMYQISLDAAKTVFNSMSATLYRRWYQEVEVSYSVTIDMGGDLGRDDSISATIQSSFDSGAWETAPTAATSSGIYTANAPESEVIVSGYDGLPAPHPPANGAIDQYSDISNDDVQSAARHVVALAARRAASGRRSQTLSFSKVLDPRFEIGSTIAVSAYGVSATGQVVEFEDTLDHDSGEIVTRFVLACPRGPGSETSSSAVVSIPSAGVNHYLNPPVLGKFFGADIDTEIPENEDDLVGFLSNTLQTADFYSPTAPVFQEQFRIVMPEIPAEWRDPVTIESVIDADISISGSGLSITF